MNDTREITLTQEMPFTMILPIGKTIHHRHLQPLAFGLHQGGEVMKMNTLLIGVLDDMKNHIMSHTVTWMLLTIMKLIHIRILIGFVMAIAVSVIFVIRELTG